MPGGAASPIQNQNDFAVRHGSNTPPLAPHNRVDNESKLTENLIRSFLKNKLSKSSAFSDIKLLKKL